VIASVNPCTGVEMARFAPLGAEAVDAALTAAVRAQNGWRRRPMAERTGLLRTIAGLLRADRERLAALITAEMGKPLDEARAEIDKCALACDHYAEHAPAYLGEEQVTANASVVHDPLGVILAVMPWNYPFWQFFRFAAPALAAGNGVVLKHADNVPRCALAIRDLLKAADAPEGLVNVLLIEVEQVAGLVADPRITAVTLTGSPRAGSAVAAQAGAALKKQVLELGGSDPFIVLADADVPAAAATAVRARFLNAGQSCISAKRFIVEDRVADEFVDALTAATQALRVGDPADPQTDIGPLARADLRDTLHDQVTRTVAQGATLLMGGEPFEGPGFFYAPTVVDHVTTEMTAFGEETFGPFAAVTRAIDADEAIRLANHSEFGLGAALWTADLGRARAYARALEAGAVFVNGMVASDARLPFGGVKKSGYGRELGEPGIREFVNTKTVWIGPEEASR
jgi:succinate-semialdehyde dehydrogenase / glutarate-semialdehyde dehydrogenase